MLYKHTQDEKLLLSVDIRPPPQVVSFLCIQRPVKLAPAHTCTT